MVYTSYFGQMRNFPENVIPVAICGGIPTWYKGAWYKKPAPKYEFFQKWKQTHDNEYYIGQYNKEVLDKLNWQTVIADVHLLIPEDIRATMQSSIWTSPDVHVVLLCYEKPEDFCHRHLFAEWLNSKADWVMVKEWKY
jgi:hypothetical protein